MNTDRINTYFKDLSIDYLYHLGIDTSMNIASVFEDVKYVVFTPANIQAQVVVNEFARTIYNIPHENFSYEPIFKTERFHLYKVGMVIIISGGFGIQSILICINEITKLLIHLKKYDVCYFKFGVANGLGTDEGDIIISNNVVNNSFENKFNSMECGNLQEYPTIFNDKIARELLAFSHSHGITNTYSGITLSAHNFNDMQIIMRDTITPNPELSGINKYLNDAYNLGVRSIDMESLSFAGFCTYLDIPACVIDITISNLLAKTHTPVTLNTQLNMLSGFAKVLVAYIYKNTLNMQVANTINHNAILYKKNKHHVKTPVMYDYLYNLNLSLTPEILDMFRGIKYVCLQGSGIRAKALAQQLAKLTMGVEKTFFIPQDLFKKSYFEGYRVGNILSVSHGMGALSVICLLSDLTRLMQVSGNTDFEYIRIGTSGGLNIEPGSIVLTDTAYHCDLSIGSTMVMGGQEILVPTQLNQALNRDIIKAQPEDLPFKLYWGNTIAADDFYLGQCRFDGAIKPRYNKAMQQDYFKQIMDKNIYNFEMESIAMASFCNLAKIRAAMITVTLLNRSHGDQVSTSSEELDEFSERSRMVAINYLMSRIKSAR